MVVTSNPTLSGSGVLDVTGVLLRGQLEEITNKQGNEQKPDKNEEVKNRGDSLVEKFHEETTII